MTIDKKKATKILIEEGKRAEKESALPEWVALVERLSDACKGAAKTHIAFLGTALLAKATDLKSDVFSVKAKSGFPGAYSARGLGHGVLVTNASQLKMSLGVSGREPLNNQPYFRIQRLDDNVPVHRAARPVLDLLLEILGRLSIVDSEEEARSALRAFIQVRRRHMPQYPVLVAAVTISTAELAEIIANFVRVNSEGGKRAQAVAAGLLDLFAGYENVRTPRRVNDPSRRYPGDVCLHAADDPEAIEKAFEIRDKNVSEADVIIFAQAVLAKAGGDAAVLAVAENQGQINIAEIDEWAKQQNLGVTVFLGWKQFVEQVLFWSATPKLVGTSTAISLIYERLKELEVSSEGAELWALLVSRVVRM